MYVYSHKFLHHVCYSCTHICTSLVAYRFFVAHFGASKYWNIQNDDFTFVLHGRDSWSLTISKGLLDSCATVSFSGRTSVEFVAEVSQPPCRDMTGVGQNERRRWKGSPERESEEEIPWKLCLNARASPPAPAKWTMLPAVTLTVAGEGDSRTLGSCALPLVQISKLRDKVGPQRAKYFVNLLKHSGNYLYHLL